MSEPAPSIALLDAEGRVVTFLRPDLPIGWSPPPGYSICAADQLSPGWQFAPPPVDPVPPEVTPRQLRLWLLSVGITDTAIRSMLGAIADENERERAFIEYDYAQTYRRDHFLVAQLGGALGFNAGQIDDGFRAAAKL